MRPAVLLTLPALGAALAVTGAAPHRASIDSAVGTTRAASVRAEDVRPRGRHGPAQTSADSLPAYTLEDQFGRRHARPVLGERRLVLLIGDRAGGPVCSALATHLAPQALVVSRGVAVLTVAALRGVPFFVKPRVRQSLRTENPDPVLLDWDGILSRPLGHEAGSCLLVVARDDGRVAARLPLWSTSSADQARAALVMKRALSTTQP